MMEHNIRKSMSFYLNPMRRLGIKKYSYKLPFILTIGTYVGLELYAYLLVKDPSIVGLPAIILAVVLIIYFSFRDGIRGGMIATLITSAYYLYITYSRHYVGAQRDGAIETIFFLSVLYIFLSSVIGWLKQTIDTMMGREVEARHLAEDGQIRLQTILQQLPVGVLLVSVDGQKLEGNKHLEKILGKKVRNKLETSSNYRSPYARRDGKSLSPNEWPIVRAFTKGETVKAEEIEYIREDKKHLFLRVNAAPIKNTNDRIIAAVSTLYDITQERELEQRKDDFVNMASHELKTPLTSMKIYIDVLLNRVQKYEDEKTLKTILSIKSQTNRLQRLVTDLLDVSRIHTGKLYLSKERFNINELIQEVVDVLQTSTSEQKIIFNQTLPIWIRADKFRIYQVLTNLIINAIKYSLPDGNIIITINEKNKKTTVSVKDNGVGIKKKEQKNIFNRLYQVADAKGKTFPGLGMGLYISKEIIRKHKGSIWVESEHNKGATFYFSLPIKSTE